MWVRFTSDFDFSPKERAGRVTISYPAGFEANVTRECADLALKAKAAVKLAAKRRHEVKK